MFAKAKSSGSGNSGSGASIEITGTAERRSPHRVFSSCLDEGGTHVRKNTHGGFGRYGITYDGGFGTNPDSEQRSRRRSDVGHDVGFSTARRLACLKGRWYFRLQR